MSENEKLGDSVRAVDRALEILMAFTVKDQRLTASELLKRVDLSRPTLYRLLRALEHNGFIVSTGDPQRFELGPSVAHLAHVWSASLDVVSIAQPAMQKLWNETGETVSLLVHQGPSRICVAELPSGQPLSFKRGVGYREDVTLGASGRVILAHIPHPESYLTKDKVKKADVPAYLERLRRIRDAGFAVSKDELINGAVAVAAPFFVGGDKVMGSLAVFGPSVRMDDARVAEVAALLTSEAEKLSQALGQR